MKRLCLSLLLLLSIIGCTKKDDTTGPANSTELVAADYFPFATGRMWTFSTMQSDKNGVIDSSTQSTGSATVLRMNQLVGGRADATILGVNNGSPDQNMIFALDRSRLLTYIGADPSAPLTIPNDQVIWSPSDPHATYAVKGRSTKCVLTSTAFGASVYTIAQVPRPSVATASIIAPDTLLITGTGVGMTSMLLRRNGAPQDTMRIAISVFEEQHAYGPFVAAWMPIWEATSSTAPITMFTWDSSYSFGVTTTLLTNAPFSDHIIYTMTSVYAGKETVNALNAAMETEKFIVTFTVSETITLNGIVRFDGLSVNQSLTLWCIKGTGPVKGITGGGAKGNTVVYYYKETSPMAEVQSSEAFGSPRVSYSNYIDPANGLKIGKITIDNTPLVNGGSSYFLLRSKNF